MIHLLASQTMLREVRRRISRPLFRLARWIAPPARIIQGDPNPCDCHGSASVVDHEAKISSGEQADERALRTHDDKK